MQTRWPRVKLYHLVVPQWGVGVWRVGPDPRPAWRTTGERSDSGVAVAEHGARTRVLLIGGDARTLRSLRLFLDALGVFEAVAGATRGGGPKPAAPPPPAGGGPGSAPPRPPR